MLRNTVICLIQEGWKGVKMNNKVVRSFNIDQELDNYLTKKSRQSNQSKSQLINLILKDWVLSEFMFNKGGGHDQ